MKTIFLPVHFAATYDCNAYGADTYNSAGECATTQPTATANGGLSYTGLDVALPLGFGIALIVAALVMIVRRKRTRHAATK